MLKRSMLAVLFAVVYLATFAAGSFAHPFGVTQTLGARGLGVRLFVWDGLVLMVALYLLTLGVEAIGKRLQDLAPWTTASLLVAALLGYLLRFGFVTREL